MTLDASRRAWLGLAAVLVLGAALRLQMIGAESLWLDEACSIEAAQKSLAGIVEYTADDVHPPLYYWVLHYWIQIAGRSEVALRLLSVVFSLLTIGVVYRLAAHLFGPGTGLMAALLLALSPFQIAAAQEARMYAMLAFLGAWSMSALVRLFDDTAAAHRAVLSYVLATAMMLYTHAYGFFVLGAQMLFVSGAAILLNGARQRCKRAALAQALAFILFLPWLPLFFVQLFHVQDNFWIPPAPAAELGKALLAFAGGPAAALVLPLVLYAVVRERARRWTVLLLVWAAALVVGPFAISAVSAPIFLAKYSIPGSIAFAILAARGVTLLPRPGLRVAAALVVTGLAVSPFAAGARTLTKDDWRAAVPRVEAAAQSGDLVLFEPSFGRVVFDYYATRADLIEEPFAPWRSGLTSRSFVDAMKVSVRGFDRVWLIAASWDPIAPRMVDELRSRFDLSTHLRNRGVESYLFVVRQGAK